MRNYFSLLLICCGLLLAFLGLRHLWVGERAQAKAAEQWKSAETAARTASPASAPRTTSRLLPGESVGKLVIPRLGASLYVVEGSEKEDLENGPGHVVGTALPGTSGNCVIAGHRDTVFRQLKNVHHGDEIVVETHEASYHYRVKEMSIILPTNTKCLMPTPQPELHLITCYPFYFIGSAPKGFVVTAALEAVKETSLNPQRPPD